LDRIEDAVFGGGLGGGGRHQGLGMVVEEATQGGGGTVFGAEVFITSTSAWPIGCSIGSVVAAWNFVDCCGGGGECLWYVSGLDSCLSGGGDFLSGRLGCAFGRKLLSESLFGWHSAGVFSSSQTVGANVGSRKPRG
jgi:hypothetical protein